jgi:hypothetical protein
MTGGYLRLYRSLLHHELWTGERFTRGHAWVDLLLRANYRDGTVIRGNRSIPVKRGQVFTAQTELARRWHWNRETVKLYLALLQSQDMIHIQASKGTDTGYMLVTIRNYERFQSNGSAPSDIDAVIATDMKPGIDPASTRHRPGNSKTEKKVKKNEAGGSALSWVDFLGRNEAEGRKDLERVAVAVASTRQGGRLRPSILDRLAGELALHPREAVLRACRTYLAKNYAGQGKREGYLLGIVRNEAARGPVNGLAQPLRVLQDPGQEAITQAFRDAMEA